MARAPETGFYFEPLTETLALVVEGAPFPSDDQWAWIGDPIEMTQDEAKLACGLRWPGVDPETLEVEFDLDFERAAEEAERQRLEALAGIERRPTEYDLDVDQLLSQADLLREAAREVALHETSPAALERAAEEEQMIRDLAKGLSAPTGPGRPMSVAAPPAREDAAAGPAADGKATDGKATDGKATDGKATEEKAAHEKATDEKAAEEEVADGEAAHPQGAGDAPEEAGS